MLFNEYFAASPANRNVAPNLLVATRGEPRPYQEALESYYRNNDFTLWCRNVEAFTEHVSINLVQAMQHIILDYSQVSRSILRQLNPRPRLKFWSFQDFITHVWRNPSYSKLQLASKLRAVKVSLEFLQNLKIFRPC